MEAGSPTLSAAEGATPTARQATGGAEGAARGARLPLAFIAFGVASFAHGLACLAIEPSLLLQPHLSPRVLSLVHAWVPGFLLSVCLGACYQMMPVVLGTPLACGRRRLWTHLAMHAAGATVLISGFLRGRYELVAAGGALVVLGIAIFALAAWRTFARSRRRDAIAWSFPLSASWLLATVVLGLAIAIDRRWGLIGMPTMRLLPVHAHFGFAGFFLTLLQGVAFQLVPMFTMGEARKPRCIGGGLIATQIGLLSLATGLAAGARWLAVGGGLALAVGILLSGYALLETLRSRRRRKLEMPLRAFVIGAACVTVAAVTGGAMLVSRGGSVPASHQTIYGVVIIVGALSLMVLGMLGKIVPFLVWMTAYGPKVGTERVPVATALASRGLECAWLGAHLLGVAFAIAAVSFGSGTLANAAAWLLSAGGVFYLWNFTRIARHLFAHWRPGAES